MNKLIEIGKIVSTRGLDGTMKIQSGFNLQDFKNLKVCHINNKEYRVCKFSGKTGFLFLKLNEINDVNVAETLKNQKVYVFRENISLKTSEYLIEDLLNMQVFTDENVFLGTIFSIENFGSKDVYTIKNQNKEQTFCLVENLIEKVDFENQKIILNSKILSEVIIWKSTF